MYKKILHTLFFALGSFAATAQIPTLTSTSNPQAGTWVLAYSTDSFDISTTGPGATWNYNTLPVNASDTSYADVCSASPYCSDFPGSTIYTHNEGSTSSAYYYTSSSVMSLSGVYGTDIIPYSNYEDYLRYPFTYNSTYIDTFGATFTGGTETFNRGGTITVTADGYGTLMLPNGTYTNALRVHRTENYADSISGVPFGTYITETYSWYVPNATVAVLSQSQISLNGILEPSTAFYTSQTPGTIPSGITNLQTAGQAFQLYPNPVQDELNIDFTMEQTGQVHISLLDVVGREVAVISNSTFNIGKQHVAYATAALDKGIYLVKIQTENQTAVKKIELL